MRRVPVTEYLEVDLDTEQWVCNRCEHVLGPAADSYKRYCLLHARDPQEVHPPLTDQASYNFSFDPEWVRIIEFYCPGCGTMIETEYLPPGHPLTHDIELDLESLRARHSERS